MKALTRIRQWRCAHECYLEDLQPRPTPDGDVSCPCRKCGKVLTGHCGVFLDCKWLQRGDMATVFRNCQEAGDDFTRKCAAAVSAVRSGSSEPRATLVSRARPILSALGEFVRLMIYMISAIIWIPVLLICLCFCGDDIGEEEWRHGF